MPRPAYIPTRRRCKKNRVVAARRRGPAGAGSLPQGGHKGRLYEAFFSQLLLVGMYWPVATLHDHNIRAADLKTGGPRYRLPETEADTMSLDKSKEYRLE
jgi:hypothetical protein